MRGCCYLARGLQGARDRGKIKQLQLEARQQPGAAAEALYALFVGAPQSEPAPADAHDLAAWQAANAERAELHFVRTYAACAVIADFFIELRQIRKMLESLGSR